MDRLPHIPQNEGVNDTVELLRSAFEDNLESDVFALNTAENITKYTIDEELSLEETAENVVKIHEEFVIESEKLKDTEQEIITEHVEFMYHKHLTNQNIFLKELSKLKPTDIFTKICPEEVEKYGLIQKRDLYPDIARQFLDFRFNRSHHECKGCVSSTKESKNVFRGEIRSNKVIKKAQTEKSSAEEIPFLFDPKEIIFSNFDTGQTYEQTVKIMNISPNLQGILMKRPPRLTEVFSMHFHLQKIATGMSVNLKVRFKPKIKLNLKDEAIFKCSKGPEIKLPISCHRNPPQLIGYVYNSNDYQNLPKDRHIPGSGTFSKKRQTAVNDTIDCGNCFATDYVLINLLLVNNGADSRFFWLSEEDFYKENVNNISTSLEFCKDGFWIYPTYFEMVQGESSEINIIFQPMYCGLHTQTMFLMCDNYTFRQLDIIGDSICFSRNMISIGIPNVVQDIDKQEEGHCIFLGNARYQDFLGITLSLINKSSVSLNYEFKFEMGDEEFDMSKWIEIVYAEPVLAPYSVTDVIFHLKPENSVKSGYYHTNLSLQPVKINDSTLRTPCITILDLKTESGIINGMVNCENVMLFINDIPVVSLEEEEQFLVTTKNEILEELVQNLSVVDVMILDVTVACYMEPIKPKIEEKEKNEVDILKCEKCGEIKCDCKSCEEVIPQADLVFSNPLLDFGILPVGLNVKRDFFIINMGKRKLSWKIVEIKYNMTITPYVESLPKNNLSLDFGTLKSGRKKRLSYNIVNKEPTRSVSILVLFSISTNKDSEENDNVNYNLVAESICVVTYEVIKLNIVFKTGSSVEPILCPFQMLYVGMPIELRFSIQNYSLISGCFYFLKPTGKDAEGVQIEYEPQCGELKPRSKKNIKLKLTCKDVGILENIFLPCFIGHKQELISLRLLCVVDCTHVFFYLPTKNNEYEKILWPPKVLYEYDRSWSHEYCACEELPEAYENMVQNIQSENTIKMVEKSSQTLNELMTSKSDISSTGGQDLLKTIVNIDSEIFLQDCVMQVENVTTKQPREVTVYIENVTPKSAKYTIQSINYAARENLIQEALTTSYKTTEELWEPMIEHHGILVHPETESGMLNAHELLCVKIWIYANTWGIYTEEIVVDIDEITCFALSMIIEVEGCPLHIPLGIGAITKYPTVRFGPVACGDRNKTKDIVALNTSAVDVKISWHMFYCFKDCDKENVLPFNFICDVVKRSEEKLEFDFTERFFGFEGGDCIEILPSQLNISSHSKINLPITFKPWALKDDEKKCSMRCYILGRILLDDENRFKSNYYYRKITSVLLEATASVERPSLDITVDAENNTLHVYANEVALNRDAKFYLQLNIRNSTSSFIIAHLNCLEPFGFEFPKHNIKLNSGQCQKIKLLGLLSYENIIKWASSVYSFVETCQFHPPKGSQDMVKEEVKPIAYQGKEVDEERKILTFKRHLLVHYRDGRTDEIPVNVCIYYPHIAVKPIHLKFGYILLGRTQKTIISIFNLTGYRVLFDILKSTSGQELVITPSCGEIAESTGMNHSFSNITIFFTPTECKNYQESIRICTNMPQYHIDIPIKGAGSFNEKFDGGA